MECFLQEKQATYFRSDTMPILKKLWKLKGKKDKPDSPVGQVPSEQQRSLNFKLNGSK